MRQCEAGYNATHLRSLMDRVLPKDEVFAGSLIHPESVFLQAVGPSMSAMLARRLREKFRPGNDSIHGSHQPLAHRERSLPARVHAVTAAARWVLPPSRRGLARSSWRAARRAC